MPNPNQSKLVGKVVLGWEVLHAAGHTFHGQRRYRLYRLKCSRCGRECDRSSRSIGVMRDHERKGKPGYGCRRCWKKARQQAAGPRVCKWDGNPTRSGKECGACWKRGAYNGRDASGRPLGKPNPNAAKAQLERRIRERLEALAAERALVSA